MISKVLWASLGLVTGAVVLPPPVLAHDTGMAGSIHQLRREGKKVCIADHWHYGSGTGGTKKRAEAEAIKSWADFTVLEYGSSWGSFNKAASRRVSCTSDPAGYSCDVEARPCR